MESIDLCLADKLRTYDDALPRKYLFTQIIQFSLKCYILGLETVVEECYSWLIWVTFDLEHEVWLVSHEPYFNLAETR